MMDLLLEFADSGRIGPIHGGMPQDEATAILGSGTPHPAIRMLGDRADGYPYQAAIRMTKTEVIAVFAHYEKYEKDNRSGFCRIALSKGFEQEIS